MNSDWAAFLELLLALLSGLYGWQVRRAFVQAIEMRLQDLGSPPYAPGQLRWARADALMTVHAGDQHIPAWWLLMQVEWQARLMCRSRECRLLKGPPSVRGWIGKGRTTPEQRFCSRSQSACPTAPLRLVSSELPQML